MKLRYKGGLGDASKLAGGREVAGRLPDLSNVLLSPSVLEDLQENFMKSSRKSR